ncbi:MAG: hypothetical protein O3C15_08995 [Proteobacteria bacterium]|nr:hypothetical protein [Pseudomonadota bacterium]
MDQHLYNCLRGSATENYAQGCAALQNVSPIELNKLITSAVLDNLGPLADALSYQALDLYPDNPYLLATCAKVSAMHYRWVEAADRLIRYLRIMGNEAPLNAFLLLARVQRCAENVEQAKLAIKVGMLLYPESSELAEALYELAPTAAHISNEDEMSGNAPSSTDELVVPV